MNTVTSRRKNPLAAIILLLFMIVALIPFLYSIVLSLKNYTPVLGFVGSPWVGLDNYTQILNHPAFIRLIINSFLICLTSLCGALLLGVPIALLCSLAKSPRTAATCAGLLLVPVFIPASAYFNLFFTLFSSEAFLHEHLYALTFAAQTLFPGAALIAFAGVAIGLLYRVKGRHVLQGTALGCALSALLFMFLILSPAYETTLLSANPLVYRVADTFDSYTYRSGLTQMQVSYGAALTIIKNVLQLLLAILPFLVLTSLLKKAAWQTVSQPPQQPGAERVRSPGQWIAWLASVTLVAGLLLVSGLPAFNFFPQLAQQLPASLIVTLLAMIIGLAAGCILLYAAYGSGPVLLPLTAVIMLGTSNALLARYLLLRQFGLINTVLATPLSQWLQPSILLILFLFAAIVFLCKNQSTLLLLAGAAALLTGAHALGGFIPQLVFTSAPQQYTIGVLFRQVLIPSGQVINAEPGFKALLYVSTVLPCALLGLISALLVRAGLIKAAQ